MSVTRAPLRSPRDPVSPVLAGIQPSPPGLATSFRVGGSSPWGQPPVTQERYAGCRTGMSRQTAVTSVMADVFAGDRGGGHTSAQLDLVALGFLTVGQVAGRGAAGQRGTG